MIDRIARTRMASAIRAYMDDQITAFELDKALENLLNQTSDQTIMDIGNDLWELYDDLEDHKIVASKSVWDYFNRVLLLLESNAEIETGEVRWSWGIRQAVAALCVVGFLVIVWKTGWGRHLYGYTIPFGIVSIILSWMPSVGREKTTSALKEATWPFPSIRSVLFIRRRVPDFTHRRYPQSLSNRRSHPLLYEIFVTGYHIIGWLWFSPVALLFQMLPKIEFETRIKISEEMG